MRMRDLIAIIEGKTEEIEADLNEGLFGPKRGIEAMKSNAADHGYEHKRTYTSGNKELDHHEFVSKKNPDHVITAHTSKSSGKVVSAKTGHGSEHTSFADAASANHKRG